MGLIRHPKLFRAGIDVVGVTDIKLLYDPRHPQPWQQAKSGERARTARPARRHVQSTDPADRGTPPCPPRLK
jgi:hypothetical protein